MTYISVNDYKVGNWNIKNWIKLHAGEHLNPKQNKLYIYVIKHWEN